MLDSANDVQTLASFRFRVFPCFSFFRRFFLFLQRLNSRARFPGLRPAILAMLLILDRGGEKAFLASLVLSFCFFVPREVQTVVQVGGRP